MAKFMLDGQEYCGGGGSNQIVKLTQAEYDALSDEKLSNNTIYLITDSGELTAENLFYDDTETGLGVNNVQDAIVEQNKNLNVRYNAETDTVQIFYNGTWNDWKQGSMQDLLLYHYGENNTVITGGWSAYAYKPSGSAASTKVPTISYDVNRMKIVQTSNGTEWGVGAIFTEKSIDLTNYNSIKLEVSEVTGADNGATGSIGFIVTNSKVNYYTKTKDFGITTDGEYTMDISTLNGEYYICFHIGKSGNSTASCYINSIRLCK